ncbi:MAG: hypothetical protein AAFX79_12110 [Planctomycetota bacterium]
MADSETPPEGGTNRGALDVSAEDVGRISPEGRPAYPGMGVRRMWAVFLVVGAAIIMASLGFAYFINPFAGLAAATVGGFMVMVNPALWAAIFRAKERERVASGDAPRN